MKPNNKITLFIISLLLIGIYLFCTDPQKPDFGDAPVIGNNKDILADRPPVLNDTLILYLTLQTGAEPLTYQWYKNDTVISRASSDSLKFEPLKLSDTGTYHCVVTNILGSDVSNPFKLDSINEVPVLGNNKQLIPVGVSYKDSAFSLVVTVQSGTKPYSYRWYKKDTLIVTDTTDTLEFDSLTYADTGKYQCIASNDFGSDTSKAYTLTLSGLKPLIGNNKQISPSGTPKKDSSFFMYIIATGTKPLSYQWFKDTTPVITGGATNDTLKFSALKYSDTGDYHCVVLNDFGSDTSKTHTISLTNQPPKWSVDTMHISATETQLCTLNVKDSCSDPDGDTLAFKLISGGPAGDTVMGTYYRFTPGYNDAGSYIVTVQASDGKKTSDCYLKLSVLNKNRAPCFLDTLPKTLYTVTEGAKLVINFKAVDPDGDQVSYKLTKNTLPDNGPVTFNDSQFIWQSTHHDSGMYSVEISATDKADTVKAPVSVAVGNVNLPPQIKIGSYKQGDTLRVKESDTLKFTVTATDTDAGDVPVLLSPKNKPAGAVYDTTNGNFSYIPAFSVSTGLTNTLFLNVRFFATDKKPQYSTDSFYIHIQVLDSNSAPKWTINNADLAATEGKTLSYNIKTVFAGDDESDKVIFTKTFGTFNTDTSQWSWTPSFTSFHGKDTVCVLTATDNHNPPASSSLSLTVSIADSVVPVVLSKPSNITYKSMKITWTQSAEPQFGAYKLYYDVSSNVTESSNLAATITDIYKTTDTLDDLNENTRYYARVFTYNTNNTKSGSNVVDSTTLVLNPPTLTVTSVTITNDSCAIKQPVSLISGTASSDAGIASVTAKINDAAVVVTGTASWSCSIAIANLKQWNKIEITALDIKGKTTTKTFQTFYKPALAAPTAPSISNITNRGMTVSWSQITYCDRYAVYRATANSGPYIIVKDTTSTSIKDTMLDINTQYWYEVRGYYSAPGNMRDSTDYSPYGNGTTKNWFEYVYDFGGEDEYGISIAKTSDDGYIIAGKTTKSGNTDIILFRINKSGDTLWTKKIGGTGNQDAASVFQTADNGFIITGSSLNTSENNKLYLIKTDSMGNSTLEKKYDTHSWGVKLEVANDGSYVILGNSYNESPPKLSFLKVNSSGEILKEKYYTARETHGIWSESMCKTSIIDGGFAAVGTIEEGGVWFGKMNIDGDTTWAKIYYRDFDIVLDTVMDPKSILQSNDGNYVIACNGFGSYVSLFKIDRQYKHVLWKKTYKSGTNEILYAFQITNDNGFLLIGTTDNVSFLLKTDQVGNQEWKKTFSGSAGGVNSVQCTNDGGYIISGAKKNGAYNKVYIIKTDESGNIGN